MRTIAIIPAKGYSSRLPGKNIKPLLGLPLISWTIKQALACAYVDDVYVSTDSELVSGAAADCGAIIINRPPKLCGSNTSSEAVIEHALKHIKPKPDIIVMMQCTTPFRKEHQLFNGIKKLIDTKSDSLFFGTKLGRWIWSEYCGEYIPLNYDYKNRIMTQDKKWEYIENGDYIFTYDHFKKTKNRLGGKIEMYETEKLDSFDIDTKDDFEMCEALAEYYYGFN